MEKNKKYPIEEFYVGELYLYTQFAGMTKGTYISTGLEKIQSFSLSGAINFQQGLINRYIDWENRREYTGFLTIFYKQGNKYICLHNSIAYELEGPTFIDNLVPLSELLPKIDTELLSRINVNKALQLFDILFKQNKAESKLYIGSDQSISDFYVGDLSLKEIYQSEEFPDSRKRYIDLPLHQMLSKSSLEVYSYGEPNYVNTVYRCLFLKDIVDLYNINDNQFYNHNEDSIKNIISFKDYMEEFKIQIPSVTISIPKALKLFKRTI